ncbi:hypothetical protein GXP67_12805 [Rhodocytophaga rosea]|uniref:Uncharacterized protein n=1 Tax=Rhodocytophaga rosea TaxID=2704465 RepID=A0A6C0GHM4_9BACT|nr:hypothetical protein [Rhodocytophaga rosea]QHT67447.1 hypothetical protein GXP67_12805 [Rhodocytophaga rosea]
MYRKIIVSMWVLFCLLAGSLSSYAQLDQVLRLEIAPEKPDGDNELFNVISMKEKGLLVSTQTIYPELGNHLWRIARYDTMLNKVWEKQYAIKSLFIPTKVYKNDDFLYVLLTQKESLKIAIFRLDFSNGEYEMIEGSTLAYIDVTHFKVLSNTAYIGGLVRYRPVVVAFNFFDKRSRVLPALYEPNSELDNLEIDNYENVVDVVTYNINRRKSNLIIRSFDYGGRMLKNITVESQKEKSLQTGKISSLNENEQFLIGNYSIRNSPYAQGMYMAKFNGDDQEFIKYFKFNDFENFFNFMKPRRKARVKNRIVKKREKGKEYQLRYRVLLHDIIEKDNQYILIGEAYFPQYRSSSIYGGMYSRSYNDRIFDGYKYTHAVVSGFDKQGNLLWDNCFEIQDYTSYDLEEIVKVAVDDEKIILVYPQDETLNTKLIKGNEVIKGKENYPIKTNYEGDKILDSEDVNVSEWYGKYFITWGQQEISNNKDAGVRNNRKVFYLNKITYNASEATMLHEDKERE